MPETPYLTPAEVAVVTKTLEEYSESAIDAAMLVRFTDPGIVELNGYATANQLHCLAEVLDRLNELPRSADVVPIRED